jgi:hypothetical integral membrane protein (TIGR02206 family)
MAFIAALGVLIVTFRERLRMSGKESYLLALATAVALILETGLHLGQYLGRPHYEFLRGLIPFELCAVTLWLSVALCVSKSEKVFELLYFWSLGAVASLLFANDDGAGPNRFHYYQYFGTHAYIVLTVVYFAAVRGYSIRLKSLVMAVGVLFPITLALRFFDQAFAGPPYEFNFMFLLGPPDVSTPLDSFGRGWEYYFGFVGLCAALMLVAYLPWPVARALRAARGRGTRRKNR